jgi:hypothetical protein
MGTEYYIARHDKKELFDLGKGFYRFRDDEDKSWFDDNEKLLTSIREVFHPDYVKDEYCVWLRDKILLWLDGAQKEDVQIISEHEADFEPYSAKNCEWIYKRTGTRYKDDT